MNKNVAYYMGLRYEVKTVLENGLYKTTINELDISEVGSTEEESIRKCLDSKYELITTLIKNGVAVPEPNIVQENPFQQKNYVEVDNKPKSKPITQEYDETELKLLKLLNELFSIQKIKYVDFNSVIPFNKNIVKLRELEKNNDDLVLYGFDTENEGISTISLISTITKTLHGRVLAFDIDGPTDNQKEWIITGVKFINDNKC